MNYLDTNIVLRVILGDVPKQTKLALQRIQNQPCQISDLAIIETVFVLERYYKLKRVDIETAIAALSQIDTVHFNKKLLFRALRRFVLHKKLSLEDCLLTAIAESNDAELLTFDKALTKAVPSAKLLE